MTSASDEKICTNCIEKEPGLTEQLSLDFSALNFWSSSKEEIAIAERMAKNIDNPNGTVVRNFAKMNFYQTDFVACVGGKR